MWITRNDTMRCLIYASTTFSIPTVELVSGVINFRNQLIYTVEKYQDFNTNETQEVNEKFIGQSVRQERKRNKFA